MKKIALLLAMLLLAFAVCSCSKDEPKKPIDTTNLVGTEKLVAEFLNAVKIEKAPEAEVEKDDTPMAEAFDIPYQYDLAPYITISKDDYTGIELTKMSSDVTQEALLEAVNADLAEYGKETEITDRGAKYGDILDINFKGFESGVAFDGGTAENYEMVLGEAGFIDGFEEQLVGHKVGEEFTIDVTFPENYSEPLAGKPAQFEIKINSITEKTSVELTDEFAEKNFRCETVNDYLLQKYQEVHASNLSEVDNARKSLAYSIIFENATIKELPLDRYDLYATQVENDIKSTAEMYGMSLEDFVAQNGMTMDDFNSYVKEQATAIVEQELIAYSIANNEGLLKDVTKTDFNKYLAELAASYGTTPENFASSYPTDMIWNSLVLELAIEYVIDNSVTK